MDFVSDLMALLLRQGARQYGDERVSQLAHALQCATMAERAGAPDSLICAALLHDVGHLVLDDEAAAHQGIDARHEIAGERYLAQHFGPAVSEPVRLHVAAKRYLCAIDAAYMADLSPASVRSLAVQGGPYDTAAAAAFVATPWAGDAVSLRRWDDHAKDPTAKTPGLEHFRRHLAGAVTAA